MPPDDVPASRRLLVSSSGLIRLGGLAAMAGGVAFIALWYWPGITQPGDIEFILILGAMAAVAALHALHRGLYGWPGGVASLASLAGLALIGSYSVSSFLIRLPTIEVVGQCWRRWVWFSWE